jgi:hypothetical protein
MIEFIFEPDTFKDKLNLFYGNCTITNEECQTQLIMSDSNTIPVHCLIFCYPKEGEFSLILFFSNQQELKNQQAILKNLKKK